jgi:glutathione synthase/RimK-type ligase-like ATP-grasp enzyme
MSGPRIAIATCASYDGFKADDDLLREALEARGAEATAAIWDDAGVDWASFDLCLIRSTWDYNGKYEEFLAWTRQVESATALRNPANLIAWNSDKTYLRKLAESGVLTVPTAWVERDSEADLQKILAAEGWNQAVVKPVVDLGAKNLHRAQAGDPAAQQALETVLQRQDAMVQPFLPSLETEGELSLIYIEGTLTHAVRKRPAPGDFRVQAIWGGTFTREEPEPAHVELAEQALATLGQPPLYARVDIVSSSDGNPCLIELELIEPNLYLSEYPAAAETLAEAVMAQLR